MINKKSFTTEELDEILAILRDYYDNEFDVFRSFHVNNDGDIEFETNWIGSGIISVLRRMADTILIAPVNEDAFRVSLSNEAGGLLHY